MIRRQWRLRRAADRAQQKVTMRRADLGQHAAEMADRWHERMRSPLALPVAFGLGVVFGQLRGAVSVVGLATRLLTELVRLEHMAVTFTFLAAQAAERVHLSAATLAARRAGKGTSAGAEAP